jgi:cation transport protein ChaC
MLAAVRRAIGEDDLWVFAYASLIWRPEQPVADTRPAMLRGYHRALQMWSHVNRGTPQRPGLVFALLSGGCCKGQVHRVAAADVAHYLPVLWTREMPNPVYDPKWLTAQTPQGPVKALAFTLSRHSPSFTGHLSGAEYADIFRHARGRYGTTWDYAWDTHHQLTRMGIHDRALGRLLHSHRPESHGTPLHHAHTP